MQMEPHNIFQYKAVFRVSCKTALPIHYFTLVEKAFCKHYLVPLGCTCAAFLRGTMSEQ